MLVLMEGKFPLRSDLTWKRLDESYVLTDRSGAEFSLDPVAFLVWIQCDGKTSIGTVVDVFATGGNRDIVNAAIVAVFEKLTETGAITWN
jgi:hypothetical protein